MAPIIRSLSAALIVVFGAAAAADVTVVPLMDRTDPVWLVNGWIDLEDPERPAIVVDLENTTSQPLSTAQVWVTMSKFFTKSERLKRGDRVTWTCGKMAHADIDETPRVIPVGGRVTVKLRVVGNCQHDLEHEHFFVYVARISAGARFSDVMWKREPGDVVRLLTAAMPHD